MIHKLSDVYSCHIGENCRIWQYVTVLQGAQIGNDANICANCFIENDVILGDRVTLKCGVYLWDGIRIGNDVFIGPNATFCNDKFPRSKYHERAIGRIVIEDGASVGAGAVILPGVTIGKNAMVGAGAVVTNSVPPYAIVKGNPAQITDYICTVDNINTTLESKLNVGLIGVGNVALFQLKHAQDMRGEISVGEVPCDIPFHIRRYFLVYNVPNRKIRGEHAHYKCKQFLVCAHGHCSVVVDDGKNRREILLDKNDIGLYLPQMTWGIQYKFSADAVLLVFASEVYDKSDYIRDYNFFCALMEKYNHE